MKTEKGFLFITILLMVCLLFTGCKNFYMEFTEPPTPEDVSSFFEANRNDVLLVTALLRDAYVGHSVYVTDTSGTILVDYHTEQLESSEAKEAVQRLFQAGCLRLGKDDYDGPETIFFCIWSRTRRNMDVGLACTTDGTVEPKMECQIECTEIEDGWYYYLEDYEAYRNR